MSLNKNALSEEFSFLILKVTNICEGKLTNISFKEDGKIIVTRDFSNRKLRSKKKDIIETELDINEIRQAYEYKEDRSMKKTNLSTQRKKKIPKNPMSSKSEKFENYESSIDEDYYENIYGIEGSKKNYLKQSSVLSQISNEIGNDDPENAWISINSTLETVFGRDKKLKSPEDGSKSKYLKLISELQDCEFLNQYKELIKLWKIKAEDTFGHEALELMQTMAPSQKRQAEKEPENLRKKVKWETVVEALRNTSNNNMVEASNDKTLMLSPKASNNDINSIKEELITWNITFNKYNEVERTLKIEKLKHFVGLKQHYINLWQAATQETPHGSKSLSGKEKIEQSIPLGNNPPPKILRGWISHHIRSSLLISDSTERKYWNSLCLLVALLSNDLVTYESLIDAEATPNFFIKMKKSDRQQFYKRFIRNENIIYKPFLQIGNKVEEEDDDVNDVDS